jgi:RNase P/RNase MRP subunit p30
LYADLSLRPQSTGDAIALLKAAARLGYDLVAIEESEGLDKERIREESSRSRVAVVWRRTVASADKRFMASAARGKTGGLVVAEPLSLEAARFAATSKRFHVLRVTPGGERLIDKSTLRLFRERGWGAVEVTLRFFLGDWGPREWRYYSVSLRRALAYGVSLVIVSDASKPEQLWHPHSIIGLSVAAGLPSLEARRCITSVPRSVVSAAGLG